MKKIAAISMAAFMAAIPAAQAQEDILRLGVGILGFAIQQSQQQKAPAPQQPQRTQVPRPAVAVAPVFRNDVPLPRPRPEMLVAEATGNAPVTDFVPATIALDHNRSAMSLQVEGDLVTITYSRPRDGLQQAGVNPGTVLFQGAVVNGRLYGDAFAFKQGCAPAAYPVEGSFDSFGIILDGAGPVRNGCNVSRLDPNSPHSHLEFSGDASTLTAMLPTEQKTAPIIAAVPPPIAPEEVIPHVEPAPTSPPIAEIQPVAPVVVSTPVAANPPPMVATPAPTPVVAEQPKPVPLPALQSPESTVAPVTPAPVAAPVVKPVPTKPRLDIDL